MADEQRRAYSAHYTVTFRSAKYHQIENTAMGRKHFMVTQDGQPYCFAFDPNAASHVMLGLSLVDAIVNGDLATRGQIIAGIEKLRRDGNSLIIPGASN